MGRRPPANRRCCGSSSVTLGLRILSSPNVCDLASIQVDQPRVRIAIYADGSDNPGSRHNWPQDLLNLAVGRYQITNGTVELDERSLPVNLRGEGLTLKLSYDPRTPSYLAELGSRRLRVALAGLAPMELGYRRDSRWRSRVWWFRRCGSPPAIARGFAGRDREHPGAARPSA